MGLNGSTVLNLALLWYVMHAPDFLLFPMQHIILSLFLL